MNICQKQVSRAGISNYITQYLWDEITCYLYLDTCIWHNTPHSEHGITHSTQHDNCKVEQNLSTQKWHWKLQFRWWTIRHVHDESLPWRHNGHDCVSNHQPHDYLFSRLIRHRSKKTSKLRVIGPCVGNSPMTGEFPTQMASNAENVSIWWHHHDFGEQRPCYIWVVFCISLR